MKPSTPGRPSKPIREAMLWLVMLCMIGAVFFALGLLAGHGLAALQ